MAKKHINAILKIEYKSKRDGLKVYGKTKSVPALNIGDFGFVEPLGRISLECNPGKTHAFYPSKWKYEWLIKVGPDDFEPIQKVLTH